MILVLICFWCAQNSALLYIIVRAYRLWIGEIIDYPLFDVVSCASKGHGLFLVTPVHFRRIVESMVKIMFRSRYCHVDYLWSTHDYR